ncbi:MAG TPA: chemotaxis protein [Comamonadaceae bacterium]|nr:chemotaxis protein [Comamonadaceae bacterium]
MSLFSTLSLKLRLIITTAALVALGVAVLSAFNFFTVRSSAMATLTESTSGLAKARADGIAEWVKTRAAVVQSLEPATRLSEPLPALIQGVKSGGFDTTYIGYANKTALFSAPQNLPPDWDPTGRPWYKQAEATQGIALTEPYVDAGSKKLVMTFALAVKDAGSTVAVAAADVFMDVVAHSVTAISPTPSSDAFVVSRGGKVLVHKNLELVLKEAVALSPELTPSAIGAMVNASALTAMSINGTPRLLLGTPIAGTDWVLMVSLHRSEALAGVTQLLLNSIIGGLVVAGLSVLVAAAVVARSMAGLGRLERAMQDVASGDGDLTRRLSIRGNDELARIAQAFNQFVEKIRLTLVDIRNTSASVHLASEEIATGNHDLSARTEQTAANLQETASSMEQMTSAVGQAAQTAAEANQIAATAAQSAQRGGAVVAKVVRSMEEITHSSRKINDIISVIDGIAFQTNILALNAAVEAARAGDQGRGFAVVASEVRTLAQRSAEAAKEIKALIQNSVSAVDAGSGLVHDAGQSMQEIVANVGRVAQLMQEISTAATEQRAGIAQVGTAINNLDQMTQQNAALVEESAAAASSLKDQAEHLAQTVAQFKVGSP